MIVLRGLIGQAGVIALLPVTVGGKLEPVNVIMERKAIVQVLQLMSKCATISDVGKECCTITAGLQIQKEIASNRSGKKLIHFICQRVTHFLNDVLYGVCRNITVLLSTSGVVNLTMQNSLEWRSTTGVITRAKNYRKFHFVSQIVSMTTEKFLSNVLSRRAILLNVLLISKSNLMVSLVNMKKLKARVRE